MKSQPTISRTQVFAFITFCCVAALSLTTMDGKAAELQSKPAAPGVVRAPVPPGGDPLSAVGLGSEVTVLVVLQPDCSACQESIPFYKSLLALLRMDGKVRRLVVIGKQGVIPVSEMLKANGFYPHRLTSGPGKPVADITDVPTIIVLDSGGKRRGTWTGLLTAEQQKSVISAVSRIK